MIIQKCLADYDTRYASFEKLMKDIKTVLNGPSNVFLRFLKYIPGFRTGKIWKKCIAVYIYAAIVISLTVGIKDGASDLIEGTVVILTEVVVMCDAFGLWR